MSPFAMAIAIWLAGFLESAGLVVTPRSLVLDPRPQSITQLEEVEVDQDFHGSYWMRLDNLGDVQYTGTIRVGGQQLKAIVDTGSFELLVFGVRCTMCGTTTNLYNGNKSHHYTPSDFAHTHKFGSGKTHSVEVTDEVHIGHLRIPAQVFWEVVDADMPVLSDDSFEAIIGVGPPLSVVRFAEEEANKVHHEYEEYLGLGNRATQKVQGVVQHFDEEVRHARNRSTVAQSLDVDSMAICLGKTSGSHGYFIWNDRRSTEMMGRFTEMDVVGDVYWSVSLTNVKLDGIDLEDRLLSASLDPTRLTHPTRIGCFEERCSAVIDTGTSLLVAPSDMAQKIFDTMDKFILAGGTCDDLSKLPDLEFIMNGYKFSLPPEAYVGKIDGEVDPEMKTFLPHVYQMHYRNAGCHPLVMTMDASSQHGQLWILGMPFFRKYFTHFQFQKHVGNSQVPRAKSMAFSEADGTCRPIRSPTRPVGVETASELIAKHWPTKRPSQLRVDGSKLRVHHLALQAREVARNKIFKKAHFTI